MSEAVPVYVLRRAVLRPELLGLWHGPSWTQAETLEVASFRSEGTGHRPRTLVRLLWDTEGIHGIFRVDDRYVRCVHRANGDPVYKDSCVEFFVQPCPGRGYLNFEFNAGGAVLASHILDPTRTPEGFRHSTPLTVADYRMVRVRHSQPPVVEPEARQTTRWTLEFFLPFVILARYAGAALPGVGAEWRGNFFKCGDETSHPHWASWSPLDERNFHLPRCFGILRFA